MIDLRKCRGLMALSLVFTMSTAGEAEVTLPKIFTEHMVLQQAQKNRVWGHAAANEAITVTIGEQRHGVTANAEGQWTATLDPLPAGGPLTLTIAGTNTITFSDVLVGEVWICSGQSNMQFGVNSSYDGDLETRTAKFPKIRLISVPQVGTQEAKSDFAGDGWKTCTPETVGGFSGVGFFFGRQLHQTLDVPVGLINDAWGGSACEAWIRRDLLASDERFQPLMKDWADREARLPARQADYANKIAEWKAAVEKAKAENQAPPKQPGGNPDDEMRGNARPGNIYNGVLKPTIGYGIRGAIWYQGESNASRAYQYRELFPTMIKSWRDEWAQGDFPFYWVQLADFQAEATQPGQSNWAELREAQTMTLSKLPNTGEAVILNLGEGRDIHPRNKIDVGKRLARWALAETYGLPIVHKSPRYQSMEKNGESITLTFTDVGTKLYNFDFDRCIGFAVAGADQKFAWAEGKIVGKDKIEVRSTQVPDPVAVRYAWADNPVCNVGSWEGLPLTPFRTDDWPGITINNGTK